MVFVFDFDFATTQRNHLSLVLVQPRTENQSRVALRDSSRLAGVPELVSDSHGAPVCLQSGLSGRKRGRGSYTKKKWCGRWPCSAQRDPSSPSQAHFFFASSEFDNPPSKPSKQGLQCDNADPTPSNGKPPGFRCFRRHEHRAPQLLSSVRSCVIRLAACRFDLDDDVSSSLTQGWERGSAGSPHQIFCHKSWVRVTFARASSHLFEICSFLSRWSEASSCSL